VAAKQTSGKTRFNPTFHSVIKAGDTLFALGEKSKLKVIEGIWPRQRNFDLWPKKTITPRENILLKG
jgi:hypothetical protein